MIKRNISYQSLVKPVGKKKKKKLFFFNRNSSVDAAVNNLSKIIWFTDLEMGMYFIWEMFGDCLDMVMF